MRVSGSGFRVDGSGSSVGFQLGVGSVPCSQGSGFGFRVYGSGFKLQLSGIWVVGWRVDGSGSCVEGSTRRASI